MSVLWKEGSGTVSEVWEALEDELAYSTVLTMLRTLENKGHVRHEQEGKAFRYYPVVQPEEETARSTTSACAAQCSSAGMVSRAYP